MTSSPSVNYGEFLKAISDRFDAHLREVQTEFNFDLGGELEVAICKTLRAILPEKYGVCRGFVVGADGTVAGDDVVVYDRSRFAPLRLLPADDYAQKQRIPAEAVYAYIEFKNTLYLTGDGGQSLNKAVAQVRAVKSIAREPVTYNQIDHRTSVGVGKGRPRRGTPHVRNPMYGVIISKNFDAARRPVDHGLTDQLVLNAACAMISKTAGAPDFILAGRDLLALPVVDDVVEGPFFVDGESRLKAHKTPTPGIGTAMALLSYAVDTMVLGSIHWPSVIGEGMGIPVSDKDG